MELACSLKVFDYLAIPFGALALPWVRFLVTGSLADYFFDEFLVLDVPPCVYSVLGDAMGCTWIFLPLLVG